MKRETDIDTDPYTNNYLYINSMIGDNAHSHARNELSHTDSHIVRIDRNRNMIKLLLEHGADINTINKCGYAFFKVIVKEIWPVTTYFGANHIDITRFLIDKGADFNITDERKVKILLFTES